MKNPSVLFGTEGFHWHIALLLAAINLPQVQVRQVPLQALQPQQRSS